MTKTDYIKEKIMIVMHLCGSNSGDKRVPILKDILSKYDTRTQIDNALHKVVRFEETIDEFIERKECEI